MRPLVIRSLAGDAGSLWAPDFPALSKRFHFWSGASGRRYVCGVFTPGKLPAYERAVALFVRKADRQVVGVAAGLTDRSAIAEADEVHVHLTSDGAELARAFRDLSALLAPADPAPIRVVRVLPFQSRAAIHSSAVSRMPSASSSLTVAST
jgi:hypothetical protein